MKIRQAFMGKKWKWILCLFLSLALSCFYGCTCRRTYTPYPMKHQAVACIPTGNSTGATSLQTGEPHAVAGRVDNPSKKQGATSSHNTSRTLLRITEEKPSRPENGAELPEPSTYVSTSRHPEEEKKPEDIPRHMESDTSTVSTIESSRDITPGTFGEVVCKTLRKKIAEKNPAAIDLVFCLDTSGSMDGLIQAAKDKIWDISRQVKGQNPSMTLRMALIYYGTPSYGETNGFVRTMSDFTSDLNQIQQILSHTHCDGGDEFVARAISEALLLPNWDTNMNTLRLIYVAGNEGVWQDPRIDLMKLCDVVKHNDITLNMIYCGRSQEGIDNGWEDIARRGKGAYCAIDITEPQLAGPGCISGSPEQQSPGHGFIPASSPSEGINDSSFYTQKSDYGFFPAHNTK